MTLKNQRVAAKAKNSKSRANIKRKVSNVENNEVDEIESLFSNNTKKLIDDNKSIKYDSKQSADLNKYSLSLNQIFNDQQTVKKSKKSDSSVNSEEYFSDMSLSRPILRCLSQIKIFNPSDIQKKCMDHILSGQNVCASSITGSGKTLAFLSPIFERLIHKPDNVKPAIRVLILTPTRELANQIYDLTNDVFCKNLENVSSSILMGGKNNSEFIKKMTDNQSDDILVSTPGKIVELLNHKRFGAFEFLKNIEILVFDEVDRLLEESFADQTNEIFKACSNSQKQILLFSATIDDTVNRFLSDNEKDFESLVKIDLTSSAIFSNKLEQYFIKIKSNSNQERDNFLLYILKSMCPTNCIIFFPTREKTHAMVEFLTLFGFCVNELHGDMDQVDRHKVLKEFQQKKFPILLATDVASRGLDVASIDLIVNYRLPQVSSTYIHRVGRTARASKSGMAISLVSDSERSMVKQIRKITKNQFKRLTTDRKKIEEIIKLTEQARQQNDLKKERSIKTS